MYEIKVEDVYEDFGSNKEKFNFSNYSTKSKYYNEFKLPMHSFLLDNNKHKKARDGKKCCCNNKS